MDKPHVLDILAKKQSCFVSDLRLNPVNRRAALWDLLLLEDSAYRQKEWWEAAAYLLGKPIPDGIEKMKCLISRETEGYAGRFPVRLANARRRPQKLRRQWKSHKTSQKEKPGL